MRRLIRVSTKNMSREQWLERRRKSIGGSEAAAIVGLSKWASPFSVWADKTGRLPDKPDTEAMRQGRDLEDYIARRFMEQTGKRVHQVNAMLYSSDYPFAHADVDRLVTGEDAGLECKTTATLNLRQFNGVEFPEQYYAQCVHYLAVTGAKRWYLAVLAYGKGFFVYTLERDQNEIDALMAAEAEFWKCVEQDTPPQIDGSEASSDALQALYPFSNVETAALFGRDTVLREYMELKEQRKGLDARIGEIENSIKADMGEAESGRCGLFDISWKSQTRQTFQAKEFAKDHPAIDLTPYYKATSVRPFKVTEQEKEAG
ncbi:MAG: hypothetical protein E7425_09090 [Ruminococcaceae bacterium]|nr:hypothetical protein [Oscillospiraceae bacterium]